MGVWAGSLPSTSPSAQRWFPGLECPFGHWEKHNKFVGKVVGKAGLGEKRLISVPGWAACTAGSHPHICSTAFPGSSVKESFGGHLGRNRQQLAVPSPGSTGWVPGAHPQLCSVLEPLPSVLVSPSTNHSHLLGNPHLWAAGSLKNPKQSLPSTLRCLP